MYCNNCGLLNPDTANRCECGFDFQTKSVRWRPDEHPELSGVRGWLLFYCIVVTFVTPIVSLADLATNRRGLAVVVITVAVCGFSVYTGISLWRVERKGLKLVRAYLIMGWVIAALSMVELIVLRDFERYGGPAGQTLLSTAIWWSYFKKSKRVKATYGANLGEPVKPPLSGPPHESSGAKPGIPHA